MDEVIKTLGRVKEIIKSMVENNQSIMKQTENIKRLQDSNMEFRKMLVEFEENWKSEYNSIDPAIDPAEQRDEDLESEISEPEQSAKVELPKLSSRAMNFGSQVPFPSKEKAELNDSAFDVVRKEILAENCNCLQKFQVCYSPMVLRFFKISDVVENDIVVENVKECMAIDDYAHRLFDKTPQQADYSWKEMSSSNMANCDLMVMVETPYYFVVNVAKNLDDWHYYQVTKVALNHLTKTISDEFSCAVSLSLKIAQPVKDLEKRFQPPKRKERWKPSGDGRGFEFGLNNHLSHLFKSWVNVKRLELHDYNVIVSHLRVLGTVKNRLDNDWYKSPIKFPENVVIHGRMVSSLELLAASPYPLSIEMVFVMGGDQLLREALNELGCCAVHLTEIEINFGCDIFIPTVDSFAFQRWQIHNAIVEVGLDLIVFMGNGLIDIYGKCHCLMEARQVHDEMLDGDVVSYNSRVDGYVQNGQFEDALGVCKEMELFGLEPDGGVMVDFLLAVTITSADSVLYAKKMFMKLINKSLFQWKVMIVVYVNNSMPSEAVGLFLQMEVNGVEHDAVTIASILLACGDFLALMLGMQIYEHVEKEKLRPNLLLETALINMYATCGCLREAREVLDKMNFWDVVAIILEMRDSGVNLDFIAFVSDIAACSDLGLLDEGRYFLKWMNTHYRISPRIEHCAYLVNLLDCVGQVGEAFSVIKQMLVEPNKKVFEVFLSVCWVYSIMTIGSPKLDETEAEGLVTYTVAHCVNLAGKERPTMSDIVVNLERALAFCDENHGIISSTLSVEVTVKSQFVSSALNFQEATSKLQGKLEELHLPQPQHVILSNHIHALKSERTKLSFGSLDGVLMGYVGTQVDFGEGNQKDLPRIIGASLHKGKIELIFLVGNLGAPVEEWIVGEKTILIFDPGGCGRGCLCFKLEASLILWRVEC